MRKVLGLDLRPGDGHPRYDAVLLTSGRIEGRWGNLSLRDVLKLAEKNAVDVIAIDNVQELGRGPSDLARLFSKLKYAPRLVQVNRIGDEEVPMESLARWAGLRVEGRLSPLATAELAARLASRGIGSEVKFLEEETRILVTRGRRVGKGGMSSNRYRRVMAHAVQQLTRKIEERLKAAGIDYDIYLRKDEHGIAASHFVVYAHVTRLAGIARNMKGHDVMVRVKPVLKPTIEYTPLMSRKGGRTLGEKGVILGIDPGVTTGVAILDLSGRPLLVTSIRWASRNQILVSAYDYGKVVIVATDVRQPPEFVKKLAAATGARLYHPERDLMVSEKRELVANISRYYGVRASDAHQRDALAAALAAYRHFQPILTKAEKEARSLGMPIPVEEVKMLVLKGIPVNEAISKITAKYSGLRADKVQEIVDEGGEEGLRNLVETLYRRLFQVSVEKEEYHRRLKELSQRLEELENIVERVSRFKGALDGDNALRRALDGLAAENRALRAELEKMRGEMDRLLGLLPEVAEGRKVVVRLSRRLSGNRYEGVVFLSKNPVFDASLSEIVEKNPPKGIVAFTLPHWVWNMLTKHGIPVLKYSEESFIIGDIAIVEKEIFLRINDEKRKMEEETWEEARRRLMHVFEEYRLRRLRELSREKLPRKG